MPCASICGKVKAAIPNPAPLLLTANQLVKTTAKGGRAVTMPVKSDVMGCQRQIGRYGGAAGFCDIAVRWAVERTLGRLGRQRRVSNDY